MKGKKGYLLNTWDGKD